ncbi:hypothetical protein SAMN02745136_03523 [Anaerocolumna jejuensis DSM 15929]|uniref:Uncharacterized protein n=1 Tax=Anaerocolumna jejuensis DSM 15929 TaxID=1121322 RepID=A0A1M6VV82_9FIRM|nr:hypothetical protein SAMN02745136_03523 [Anaerocolumna jejuensis DSM 15929]
MNFGIILILISITAIIITFILNLLFKKIRYVKYIPAIVLFPFMIYNFITMYSVTNESFESLGRFVMGILLLVACASSLIASITFDIAHRNIGRKK